MSSTNILADIAIIISNGPATATKAKAIAAAGPIMDYVGNTKLAQLKFKEASVLLTSLIAVTAAGDTANKAKLVAVDAVLRGQVSPSTAVLTDLDSVIATAPGATTKASVIAAAGPIMDYVGNVSLARLKFAEASSLLTELVSVTDNSTDSTNRTKLSDILEVLV